MGSALGERSGTAEQSWRAAIATFVVVELVGLAYVVAQGRDIWFAADEWDFLATRTAWNLDDLFRPHNEHWSTLPILAYRALWWFAGLRSHMPYFVVGVALHLTVAALLFAVMRRARVDPWIATVVATIFVFFGTGYFNILFAFQLAWCFSLSVGLAYLMLVDHDGPIDRRDWLGLGLGLAALMSSGLGVTIVIVVAVAVLLRRGARLALFHAVPLGVVFIVWWAAIGRKGYGEHGTLPEAVRFLGRNLWATFRGIGHTPVVGVLLALLVVVAVVMTLRRGHTREDLAHVAVPLALLIGAPVFLLVTGVGRGEPERLFELNVSRYLYVAGLLVLPAIAVGATEFARRSRWRFVGVLVLLVLCVPGNIVDLRDGARKLVAQSTGSREFILSSPRNPIARQVPRSLQPWAFATDLTMGWLLDSLPSGRLPAPGRLTRDELATQTLILAFRRSSTAPPRPCRPLRAPVVRVIAKGASLSQRSGSADVVYLADDGARSAPRALHAVPSTAIVMPLRLLVVPHSGPHGAPPVVCG